MTYFDPYNVETWYDMDGLTFAVHPSGAAKPVREKVSKARQVFTSAVFAVGMALTNLPFSTHAIAVGGQLQLESTVEHPGLHERDDVATGHWINLLMLVRDSAMLPADDMTNDPPALV